jgi:uncharacterized membrane protein YfcA
MLALALIFGAAVGFSLGLTGGGGSILAVPLLVYGLAVAPKQAVGVSLAAVGATALAGAVQRLVRREVEVPTGLLFAIAGMIGAPAGLWIGQKLPDSVLLMAFAALMLWIAARMWLKATRQPRDAAVVRAALDQAEPDLSGPACRRDLSGRLTFTSRCTVVMALLGVLSGVMAGLFGVGGGFVIVPALVLFSGMDIRRAVATSLLVIALISAAGLASYLAAHQPLQVNLTALFVVGGIGGLALGTAAGRRMSPVLLQKVFAVVIVAVATFVMVRNVV